MAEDYTETTQQAAERLGVSDSRIRQLCIAGELDAKKIGSRERGQWFVRKGAMPEKNLEKTAKKMPETLDN